MKKEFIKAQKTARYCTLGGLNEKTENVWIVCHGYGQLAPYFIRKFEVLQDEKTYIIAPEALSRFYLEGFSGRTGAAWMTREERESDIEDYVAYLSLILDHIQKQVNKDIRLNVLGFSQGVATVCRWVVSQKINFNKLILWAGIFPPDLNTDFEFSMEHIQDKNVFIVYGDKDPFLQEKELAEMKIFKERYSDLNLIMFEGKHEIDEETLKRLK